MNSNTLRPQNVGAKVVFSGFSGCFSHSCVDFTLHLAECEQRIDAAGEKIGSREAQVLMRREEQAKGARKPVDFRAKVVHFSRKHPCFLPKCTIVFSPDHCCGVQVGAWRRKLTLPCPTSARSRHKKARKAAGNNLSGLNNIPVRHAKRRGAEGEITAARSWRVPCR